jgi:hypothetical protein
LARRGDLSLTRRLADPLRSAQTQRSLRAGNDQRCLKYPLWPLAVYDWPARVDWRGDVRGRCSCTPGR